MKRDPLAALVLGLLRVYLGEWRGFGRVSVGFPQGNAGTETAPSSRRPREGGRLPAARQNGGTSLGRFSRDLQPASRDARLCFGSFKLTAGSKGATVLGA